MTPHPFRCILVIRSHQIQPIVRRKSYPRSRISGGREQWGPSWRCYHNSHFLQAPCFREAETHVNINWTPWGPPSMIVMMLLKDFDNCPPQENIRAYFAFLIDSFSWCPFQIWSIFFFIPCINDLFFMHGLCFLLFLSENLWVLKDKWQLGRRKQSASLSRFMVGGLSI